MFRKVHVRAAARMLVAASLGLGGCASMVEGVGSSQDTRALNPDSVQGERQSSWFEKATGQAPGAKLKGSPSDRATRRFRGEEIGQDCKADANKFKFFCTQQASEANVEKADEAKRYLAAGLALSNELCDAWFNQLQVTQVTLHQGSDAISTVGSLTAAILGFTQTPSEVIGLTASVFGSAKQSVDSLAANYIVATDLTTVASAVREYRALYARDIDQTQTQWNYYTARRVLMAYDNTCSALYVRKFVNARVSGSKGDETQPLLDAAVNAFAGEWAKYFKKQITVADLIDIYAYAILPDTPEPVRKQVAAGLVERELVDAQGSVVFKDTTITTATLSNALFRANIDATIKTRAAARVDAVRGQLAAEAGDKAEAAAEQKEVADAAAATANAAGAEAGLAADKASSEEQAAAGLRQAASNARVGLDKAMIDKRAADQALATAKSALATAEAAAKAPGAAPTAAQDVTKAQGLVDQAAATAAQFKQTDIDKLNAQWRQADADATAAETKALQTRGQATQLGRNAAALGSKAQSESVAFLQARQQADDAGRAASGSRGQSSPKPDAFNAITPLGPNGRPLDAPPPP